MLMLISVSVAIGAETVDSLAQNTLSHTTEHHGLPESAQKIGSFVTNSMIVTWIVALSIILFARYATRNMKDVPEGAQNFAEWMVETLKDFLEGIMGSELARKTFWFFATVFIFILFSNWFGLIPGIGTIGWGIPDADGKLRHIMIPLFRGVNADLNMTFGMAMLFFVLWIIWGIQVNGVKGFILHIFGPKGDMTGLLRTLMIAVFVMAGFLEVVSILFRPISLSFRLYGNIFAGENMLETTSQIGPENLRWLLSWLIPIPFYLLEVLVGLIQALVFMLLTAVFTLQICMHEEGEQKHSAH
ncbi:MAG TPA: F0F1 ATP synthase subunit A [Verrucomicrobiota bacterium]|nr:F0F1 ATP synthase subunit A [Verrucomicrobiota bacterium]